MSDNEEKARQWHNTGAQYFNNKNYDDAITSFTMAIELNPKYAKAYHGRADSYYCKDEYDKAINDYTKAMELDPNCNAYNSRGSAYAKIGEDEKAINDYTKAIDIDPNDSNAYYNRGITYLYKGDYDKAIVDYTSAIRCDNEHVNAYYNRGLTYHERGRSYNNLFSDSTKENYENAIKDYTSAITDYDMAIEINKKYIETSNNGGHIRDIVICKKAEKLRLRYPDAYFNRGITYYYRGITYNKKGLTKESQKDYDNAINDYTDAITLRGNYAGAYYNKGNVHVEIGEVEKAIESYKKAFDLEYTVTSKNLSDFIFHFFSVLNDDIIIENEKLNIEYITNKLLENNFFWDDETNEDIKTLSIYEHILLYFLTLKKGDAIDRVAYNTSTRVFERLIKKDKEQKLSKIRMSTLSKVNDPEEGKILFEILNEYTKKNITEDENATKEYCAVQTSFTRCIDSLTMFRLYGKHADKEGTGVCLVFNKNLFDTIFQYNNLPNSNTQVTLTSNKDNSSSMEKDICLKPKRYIEKQPYTMYCIMIKQQMSLYLIRINQIIKR